MSKVAQDNFPRSINQFVPLMEFAADVVDGKHFINLGAPSTADPNGILAQASNTDSATNFTSADWATTFDGSSTHVGETVAGSLNAKYGRCLTIVSSAGADHVVTITGRDYLGQLMSEVLTIVNTVTVFGKKAFKYVDTVAVATGAASDTFDLGWGDRLGLPYKAEKLLNYTEDDVSFPVDPVEVPLFVDDVAYAAGVDVFSPSPIAGQITGYQSVMQVAAGGANNVNTVFVGASAVDVVGLTITHVNPTAVGVADSDIVTTDDDQATSRVDKFEAMGISGDGGGTGEVNYLVTVEPLTFIAGPDTDPQTTTTTDPRGTILVTTPCDASIEYEIAYTVDTSNLHGVVQV